MSMDGQVISLKDMVEQIATMRANMAKLSAENAALRTKPASRVSMKLTEKGGVSLYGLGRFPVTLYKGQWERLLASKEEIEGFLVANASKLSVKEE